jgi:hypothetical protein
MLLAFDVGQDWFWFDVIVCLVFASPVLAAIVLFGTGLAVVWAVEPRRHARERDGQRSAVPSAPERVSARDGPRG